MKKILFLLAMLPMMCFAQNVNDENKSKLELFISEKGTQIRFEDTFLEDLQGRTGAGYYKNSANVRIRKVFKGESSKLFLRIVNNEDGVDNAIAFIEHSDVKAVVEALNALVLDFEKDKNKKIDYIENKFVTEDDFAIGYYTNEGKHKWFIVLDSYGTNKSLYFSEYQDLIKCFNGALSKMNDIKKAEQ